MNKFNLRATETSLTMKAVSIREKIEARNSTGFKVDTVHLVNDMVGTPGLSGD